ncbi:hypothetical protein [Lachnotalea glycerini]|uniref:Uncharacterized protein n=1 Tax=Lachnotalea glycerini TaxID=1763509 RepID=A0A371JIE4_9FIRM|nr:hypothetical protein [Lachnotalea glycerini]RDY32496.1 hypothetical protein CG710_003440 [Lachnotalea glycerini]
MPIRPIELNGVISRVQDIGTMKHNEDNKPIVDQSNIQTHLKKEVDHHQKKVRNADDSDNHQKKYDAKEKGNGTYFANQNKKKDKKEQDQNRKKKQDIGQGFDISI